jgi:hypothetical protein
MAPRCKELIDRRRRDGGMVKQLYAKCRECEEYGACGRGFAEGVAPDGSSGRNVKSNDNPVGRNKRSALRRFATTVHRCEPTSASMNGAIKRTRPIGQPDDVASVIAFLVWDEER